MPGLKVTLPGIKPGSTVTATGRLEVVITAAGDIFVADKPVSEAIFPAALKAEVKDLDSTVVVLMADEDVPHGRIVTLMDTIRRQGLKRVVLAARWHKDEKKG